MFSIVLHELCQVWLTQSYHTSRSFLVFWLLSAVAQCVARASSYAAMRTVAGSRPVLYIVWEWHIGLGLLGSLRISHNKFLQANKQILKKKKKKNLGFLVKSNNHHQDTGYPTWAKRLKAAFIFASNSSLHKIVYHKATDNALLFAYEHIVVQIRNNTDII